jgi:hypothetical protein
MRLFIKVELTKHEYRWLADLAKRAKNEANQTNAETPHPLLLLRRDNMASLEAKLNAGIQRQIQKEGRSIR